MHTRACMHGGHGNHDSAYCLCARHFPHSTSFDPNNNPWREYGLSLQLNKVKLREVELGVQGNTGQPVSNFWLS